MSIPLEFTNAWKEFGTNNVNTFYKDSREPVMGEFVAYMEARTVKAKLKIDGRYYYFDSELTVDFDDWVYVLLLC